MMPPKWPAVVGLGVFLVALNACSSSKVPEVPVEEQWRKTIHNFSLIPIYPMRESVFVGDVRLTVDPSVVQPQILPYRNIGRIDLSKDLKDYYKRQPEFPVTKLPENGNGSGTEGKAWPQPKLAVGESIFGPGGGENRLRLAALPGVKVATVFQGSVGARAPVQGVGNVGAGAAAESSRILEISLTGIEELEAPSDFVLKEAFENFCKKPESGFTPENLRFALAQMIGEPTPELLEKAKPKIAIISRVLYARSIDYTFKTDQGFGADVAAVTEGLKSLVELSQALGPGGTQNPTEVQPTESSTLSARAEIARMAASLRSKLSASSSPGVALSATFVDARGVTLTQTFERPMAFGVQTVSYNLGELEAGKTCTQITTPGTGGPGRAG